MMMTKRMMLIMSKNPKKTTTKPTLDERKKFKFGKKVNCDEKNVVSTRRHKLKCTQDREEERESFSLFTQREENCINLKKKSCKFTLRQICALVCLLVLLIVCWQAQLIKWTSARNSIVLMVEGKWMCLCVCELMVGWKRSIDRFVCVRELKAIQIPVQLESFVFSSFEC